METAESVHQLDDGAETLPAPVYIATGELAMSISGGTPASGWIHVKAPTRLKWSTANECLSFQTEAKLDPFLCRDDPEGEAVWVLIGSQLRQWGDQTKCLASETGSDQVQLKDCTAMSEQDGWVVPEVGGAYSEIKNLQQELCLVPAAGFGARTLSLQPCSADAMQWKRDQVDGSTGTCAIRWPKTADNVNDQSGLPARRVCFHSSGQNTGTWHDDVVFEALGSPTAQGRLQNQAVLDAPSAAEDVEQCAAQCMQQPGCNGFNFESQQQLCEPLKAVRADAEDADFDESAVSAEWAYYEPETVTAGTSCTAGCLPDTTTRLQLPATGNDNFGDSAPDQLPTEAAAKFDAAVFPVAQATPDSGADNTKAECMAEADGITIEVTSYCQVAKAVECTPDTADLEKETCAESKEAHCRRMVLVPITTFSDQKAQFREKCGHGAQQATKVWDTARIALDDCSSIVGFNQHCGSVEASF